MEKYVLGVDIGTTAVKVLAMNEEHQIVYEGSKEHALFTKRPGWAEEDADVWWHHTCLLVREMLKQLRVQQSTPFAIACVGVSGMVPAIVLVDKEDRLLRLAIQQNDARCVAEINHIKERLDQTSLFESTGGYTNQQHVLPRLLWVREHEPDVWAQVDHVCGSYDFIAHRLTEQWSLELNWAAESGMFDIRQRVWILEQFEEFGIAPAWMPSVREPMDIVGRITQYAAEQTGLDAGIPVIAGSADHVASALAAGVTEEGDVLIKFGGAGDILFCADSLQTHERLFFDYHDIAGKYLLNGCMASSGSLVRWFVSQFVPQDLDGNVYQRLDDSAEAISPGSGGLVVLPYLLGEKTPIFDPDARGVFFGISLYHTPAHMFRAILESVIYGFRHHLDVLAQQDHHPKRVYATNGGAKSRLWLQIAADILGVPVIAYKNHPGSSLGVAFLAGKAIGIYTSWNEIGLCIPEQKTYYPDAEAHALYNVSYGIYRRLYEKLRDEFHLLAKTYSR